MKIQIQIICNRFLSIRKVEIYKFLPTIIICQNSTELESWILKALSCWNLKTPKPVIGLANNSISLIIAQNLNLSSPKTTYPKINQSTSHPRKRPKGCKSWINFSLKETLKLKGWLRRASLEATSKERLEKWIRCRSQWPTQCRTCNESRSVQERKMNTCLKAVAWNLLNSN